MVLQSPYSNDLNATCIIENSTFSWMRLNEVGTSVLQDSALGQLSVIYVYMIDIKEACNKLIPILYVIDIGFVSPLCCFFTTTQTN